MLTFFRMTLAEDVAERQVVLLVKVRRMRNEIFVAWHHRDRDISLQQSVAAALDVRYPARRQYFRPLFSTAAVPVFVAPLAAAPSSEL